MPKAGFPADVCQDEDADDSCSICEMSGWSDRDTEWANARLISAAPDLLSMLKRIIRATDEGCDEAVWDLIELARVTVSKAENG
jgi:hypothetical protein